MIEPELRKIQRRLEGLNRQSGLVRFSASIEAGEQANDVRLDEVDDMRRVNFECHDEPVKVLDDWNDPVHCLVCGRPKT
ncbi:MAG: hypothetical protein LC797_07780 [Chloroflexi bacterium]|nr:hypothetical protein [Chloroflexota bacterium]